jgi:hypothetical protein
MCVVIWFFSPRRRCQNSVKYTGGGGRRLLHMVAFLNQDESAHELEVKTEIFPTFS